ncbi:MAG: DUF971 domain-containing protein [Planctomycetota bacterium]|nr:MAG: DUF971 domain-containing protein [Planctomycetota bacterium]
MRPRTLDLDREKGLTVVWQDGSTSFYPVAHLRRMSPSAEQRELREEMARNPLTVLPASAAGGAPLRAESAELVGNYAVRITFSDGHRTGLYSWEHLRRIDPARDAGAGSDAG